MNKRLIKTLYAERKRLYPHGCPFAPRGCGKTFTYMIHFLTYTAYDYVCDIYKHIDNKVSLEEAHDHMREYINEMWRIAEERY